MSNFLHFFHNLTRNFLKIIRKCIKIIRQIFLNCLKCSQRFVSQFPYIVQTGRLDFLWNIIATENFFFNVFRMTLDIPKSPKRAPPLRIFLQWTLLPPNRCFAVFSRRMCFRETSVSAKVVWNTILYKIRP